MCFKNVVKSKLNGRAGTTSVHNKNETRKVIIVPLDIFINYIVVKSMGEAVSEGFHHSSNVEGDMT
jgi:hypothetical protein